MSIQIIVISKCDERYLPAIKVSKGIILQNRLGDVNSERIAMEAATKFDLPIIIGVKYASDILIEDEAVYLDPIKGLVYKLQEGEQ